MNLLSGVRAVEYARSLAAAYCGRILVQLGATVLRVEGQSGPASFLHTEKEQAGSDWQALVTDADVLIDDLSPKEAEAAGLTAICASNPRLIRTAVTHFGRDSEKAGLPAEDLTVGAAAGINWAIGEPGRPPLALPANQLSLQAGLNAAAATVAALLFREVKGRGQPVEIAAWDVLAHYAGVNSMLFTFYGLEWGRAGRRAPGSGGGYPYTVLPCKDGAIALIARSGQEWKRFVELMGIPEWSANPRYQDRKLMGMEYPGEVDDLVMPWLRERTKAEIFALCREAHVPVAPVQDMAEVLADPHLKARGFFEQEGSLRLPGLPFRIRTDAASSS